jgi:hypothetical protein
VSQQVHNLFGAAEYIAGGLGLLVFAGGRRGWSWLNRGLLFAAGLATLVAFVFMTSPYLTESRGLSQRLAETVLFGSLVLIGWRARTK